MRSAVIALLGATLLSACSWLAPALVCIDATQAECREAAAVAEASLDGGHVPIVEIRVERGRETDCTTLGRDGTSGTMRLPCPEGQFDFFARVTLQLADGSRQDRTVVRDRPLLPMKLMPFFFLN